GLTMTPVPVGATPPGSVVVIPPLGTCMIIAAARFGAGTAAIEYQDVVDCPTRGNPILSSQMGPANGIPIASVTHRKGMVLLLAKLAAPGSPGSDPQVVRFSESNAVLVEPYTPVIGIGSGFVWHRRAFRPMAMFMSSAVSPGSVAVPVSRPRSAPDVTLMM